MILIFNVIKPGLLTTIQDLGRKGYQKYGMSVSGAVDHYAHRIANILVGNQENAATLEVTLIGPTFKVLETRTIAITGADLTPYLNNCPVPLWRSFTVHEGDILSFQGYRSGCRAYIAVAGGMDAENTLGSKSTDLISEIGGHHGRRLTKGDTIKATNVQANNEKCFARRLSIELIPTYTKNVRVRTILGPQEDSFTTKGIETFLSSEYTVTKDSNRMGCRLDGPTIEHKNDADILSEGLFMGAIQVPQNGQPILFLSGRPSVGGYTKIGGVISVDLPKVAQLKPNDRVSFEIVTLDEAHEKLRKQENIIKILQAGI
ncbi:biotin-dependent carboxyltransferase family protein [Paucisalibacillus sp. EB02]|uniref:5-oxoprolinase subunit C family protein n=1 Tax=Paucisalibacillus sp. EB02 TaxID=1347087 RepID=UPI001E39C6A9|nr:biotin-dependent carboxyltransferase family protein [Paucisalibacillus sp. EB02]